jgi:hypothetical protein
LKGGILSLPGFLAPIRAHLDLLYSLLSALKVLEKKKSSPQQPIYVATELMEKKIPQPLKVQEKPAA